MHEQRLVAAIRDRAQGTSIIDALQAQAEKSLAGLSADEPAVQQFQDLLAATPPLRDHLARISRRWEHSLAVAIAEEAGLPHDDVSAAALARYALAATELSHDSNNPAEAITALFARLRHGWPEYT